MAFRSVQDTFIPMLLLLCINLLSDKKTAAVTIREKCLCIRAVNALSWRTMTDFNLIDPGPLCNKVQIIIYTGNKSTCLASNSKQGKMLQTCWKRIKFNQKKKNICMRPAKVKRRPKKP